MMESNDEGLRMASDNVIYENEITDEQIMQFVQCVGNQQFMMPEGPHMGDRRTVLHPSVESTQTMLSSPSHVNSLSLQHQSTLQQQLSSQTNPSNVAINSRNYSNTNNPYEQNPYSNSTRHDRYDYRSTDVSSGNITPISETVTHVSDTDTASLSPHGYNSVQSSVTSINVPQNYSINQNAWNHDSGNYQSLPNPSPPVPANNKVIDAHINLKASVRHLPRQRIPNAVPSVAPSLTSTPVNTVASNPTFHTFNGAMNSDGQNAQHTSRTDAQYVEKRTLIVFKVIDQFVDHTGKILKETVIKNEEIIKSFGKVPSPELNTPSSLNSSVLRVVSAQNSSNSGILGDVSSSGKSSGCSRHETNQSNDFLSKMCSPPVTQDLFVKVPTPVPKPKLTKINTSASSKSSTDSNKVLSYSSGAASNSNKSALKKDDEKPLIIETDDERRETASALLSLQVQRDLYIDTGLYDEHLPQLKKGSKVMAKWRDKNYYAAIIKEAAKNNKFAVVFEDGATRSLFENEIINIETLPVGAAAMVTISEGFCAKGTIRSMQYIEDQIYYDIEHIKDDKKEIEQYKRKDVFLTNEQAMVLNSKLGKPQTSAAVYADVDLDNIVCGKRLRNSKKGVSASDSFAAIKSVSVRKRVTDPSSTVDECKEEESDDEEMMIPQKRKKIKGNSHWNRKKGSDYVQSEHNMFMSPLSISISPRTIKSNSVLMPQNELVKHYGPLPESCIFQRLSVLLTSGDRVQEDEGNPERSTPFDKTYLTKQIETGGGHVYETFEEAKNLSGDTDIVLIADTYHLSIKYMQCLAAGIPVISHMWIVECCRQNKSLKRENYFLPSGYSVITNSLPSDKMIFKKSANLFKGMRFFYGSKNTEKLESLYSPVLLAAQAQVVNVIAAPTGTATRKASNSVDMVIADETCSEEIVKRAKQLKIPIVSGEYIVQCLINGRKLSYDANPKFSPEFIHE